MKKTILSMALFIASLATISCHKSSNYDIKPEIKDTLVKKDTIYHKATIYITNFAKNTTIKKNHKELILDSLTIPSYIKTIDSVVKGDLLEVETIGYFIIKADGSGELEHSHNAISIMMDSIVVCNYSRFDYLNISYIVN